MITQQLSVLRRLLESKDIKLNILTSCTHEGYQSLIDKTCHNFYMVTGQNWKKWDFHTRPLPPNHYVFTTEADQVKADIPFDLILCQNRAILYPFFAGVAQKLNIPIIVLDHTEPPPGINSKKLEEIKQWTGHTNVYITEHNRNSWDNPNGIIIPHGIDTAVFNGYEGTVPRGITMVNHFAQRDIFCGWNLWNEIRAGAPCDLIGENPGLSKSINNVGELVKTMRQYRYYLNTSQYSPVPLSCLEAMAIGLPVVTTAKQELPKIIKNGENGFISNDPKELTKYCNMLINDEKLAKEIGAAGRATIEKYFSLEQFIAKWNEVFYNTVEEIS